MIQSPRLLALFACILLTGSVVSSNTSAAQSEDQISRSLDVARMAYERSMEKLRTNVQRQLERELVKAAREQDPLEARRAAQKSAEAFRTRGELPSGSIKDRWIKQYATKANLLQRAYSRAIAAYDLASGDTRGSAITAEQELFATLWDLAPWGSNLIEDLRHIGDGGRLDIETELAGSYRIEILASRTGDAGGLLLEIPTPDGHRIMIPTTEDQGDNIHMLLTVTDELISADLGADRPIDLTPITDAQSSDLVLKADGGGFDVESVRVKPVVKDSIPNTKILAKKRRTTNNTEGDPFSLDLNGVGDCYHHSRATSTVRCKVTIDRRKGDLVEFRVVLPGTGETFLVRCRSKGTALTVVNAEQTKPPSKKAPFVIGRTEGGSGAIHNGVLNLSWTMRGSSPNMSKNRAWTVRIGNVVMK